MPVTLYFGTCLLFLNLYSGLSASRSFLLCFMIFLRLFLGLRILKQKYFCAIGGKIEPDTVVLIIAESRNRLYLIWNIAVPTAAVLLLRTVEHMRISARKRHADSEIHPFNRGKIQYKQQIISAINCSPVKTENTAVRVICIDPLESAPVVIYLIKRRISAVQF